MRLGFRLSKLKSALMLITATMIVGVIWEVFEYSIGFYPATKELYVSDTRIDLIMDFVGSFLVAIVVMLVGNKTQLS